MLRESKQDRPTVNFDFLQYFTRSDKQYDALKDDALLEAYQSGIYDVVFAFLGESHFKVIGISETIDDLKKAFRQLSYAAELILYDNLNQTIQTVAEQEALAESWFEENAGQCFCTLLVCMIPNDNDGKKLAAILQVFLQRHFAGFRYVFVEHMDTDVVHYHIVVDSDVRAVQKNLQGSFIAVAMEQGAKLF